MSAVNLPDVSFYRLTGEQIIQERRKNEPKTPETGVDPTAQEQQDVPNLTETLAYYRGLCREHSGFSFQLSDRTEGTKGEAGELVMGIVGLKMNQIGGNFSELEQVSIEIDIGVIHRMMTDPAFEKSMRDVISQIGQDYDLYRQNALGSNKHYTAVHIYEQNGGICVNQVVSDKPFCTEQEVIAREGRGLFHLNDMWQEYWEAYFKKLRDDMEEGFIKMAVDAPREKMLRERMGRQGSEGLFAEEAQEKKADVGKYQAAGEGETESAQL